MGVSNGKTTWKNSLSVSYEVYRYPMAQEFCFQIFIQKSENIYPHKYVYINIPSIFIRNNKLHILYMHIYPTEYYSAVKVDKPGIHTTALYESYNLC